MRLLDLFLCLFLIFITACGEEKEFMTPKSGEIVIEANTNDYSLNGVIIGKTATDVSNNADLLIKPFDTELKKVWLNQKKEPLKNNQHFKDVKVKIHIDDNLTYEDFIKFLATIGFSGYTSIQCVIGSDFKDVYTLFLPERSDSCQLAKNAEILRLLRQFNGNLNLTNDEIWNQRLKEKATLIECARKKLDLSLAIEIKGGVFSYKVGLNETGLTDGLKYYTFESNDDLWKFIDDVRSRYELRDKEDRNEIVLVFENGLILKKTTPIIKKISKYGYKIAFAHFGG